MNADTTEQTSKPSPQPNPTVGFPNLDEWKEDSDEESDDQKGDDDKSESDKESSDEEESKEQDLAGPKVYKNKRRGDDKRQELRGNYCFRGFKRQNKPKVVIPESERLITEKNEWGDYKVKGLQIKQLEKKQAAEDLNKSVRFGLLVTWFLGMACLRENWQNVRIQESSEDEQTGPTPEEIEAEKQRLAQKKQEEEERKSNVLLSFKHLGPGYLVLFIP